MAKYRMDIFKPGRKPGHPAPLFVAPARYIRF